MTLMYKPTHNNSLSHYSLFRSKLRGIKPAKIKKELEIKEKELQKKVSEEEIKAAEEQLANAKKEFKEKEREYNKAMDKYYWNRLLISVSIGSIIALVGAMLIESLGTGLVFGGVACIIYGFLCYWGIFNDLSRFAILIGAVILLFILGYWRFIRTRRNYVIS